LKFSAPPLRSLRLRGEFFQANVYRRDAEPAEIAQRTADQDTNCAMGGALIWFLVTQAVSLRVR